MTSTIKVNNIQNQCGANIINENSNTITLGASGDTIALASGASQTGFGRTGTVDWDTTPKTATFTAVSGDGFFCNTTSGGFTANLPAGVAGAIVSFADYAGTWQTGNLTVSPNGSDKIGGTNADVVLNTEGQSVTFVFADSTQGWINVQDSTSNERGNAFIVASGGTESTVNCGACKVHTFTGPGTFTVSCTALCAANNVVSYLVVAGGGGGGTHRAAGGGAGGFREAKSPVTPYTASPLDGYPSAPNRITVTAAAFPITVGAAGSGGTGPTSPAPGGTGGTSTFSTITSAGGGGGGGGCGVGVSGGSGGGGGGTNRAGGSGNTPSTTPAQGQDGGAGANGAPNYGSGGGGGATAVGEVGVTSPPGSRTIGGDGGAGATTSINGSPTAFAGGGGGSSYCAGPVSVAAGVGGTGGGGTGAGSSPEVDATNGADNTGGGGGGGQHKGGTSPAPTEQGGAGGSGIVIIRYKIA